MSESNVIYAGRGRPCPLCRKVWLMCSDDLKRHMEVCHGPENQQWQKSKYDPKVEWLLADRDLGLKTGVEQNGGKLQINNWHYTLSQDHKYIKRKLVAE